MNRSLVLLPAITVALGAVLLVACEDSSLDTADVDVEAGCAHFGFGNEIVVNAAATAGAGAPAISMPHHRYPITLAETAAGSGSYVGHIAYTPTAMARFLLMFSEDVAIELQDPTGATVTPMKVERGLAECAPAAVIYTYMLEVKTYALTVGPLSKDAVTLVIHQPPDGDDVHGAAHDAHADDAAAHDTHADDAVAHDVHDDDAKVHDAHDDDAAEHDAHMDDTHSGHDGG